MPPSEERRKHYRHEFPILVPVEYTIQTSGGDILSGFVTNISASGLCLLTRNNLERESKILIRDNRYIPFQTARVLWIQEVNKKMHYQVGLICYN
jgi:hypothetical protein